MNIQTDKSYMVFRHENEYGVSYSFGLARKNNNGGYINTYMPIRFKNGVEVKDRTSIYIKQAFLTFYLNKENKPVWYIMIMDYETVGETIEKAKEETPTQQVDAFDNFYNENKEAIDNLEDSLPF